MLKVKILIFPFSIVFIIWLAIWSIVPTWNEIQKTKTQKTGLEKKLSTLGSKNTKVNELMNAINSNTEDRDLVYTYVPNGVKEEEIIDNLNFLASKDNLFVYNLSVPLLNKYNSQVANPKATNASTIVEVNFGVIGNYDNIKGFLGKVAALKRYNNVRSLKIENEKSQTTGNQSSSLKASGIFTFNYLLDNEAGFNYEDPIFSENGRINMNIANDIREKTSTEVIELQIGTQGKSNPFIP